MITALALCGYLAAAHLATGCHPAASPHAAVMTLEATAAPAMLVFDPRDGAIDTERGALEAGGAVVEEAEWASVLVATKGEFPEGVRVWLAALDSAVQYAAAVRQDTIHLRDARAAGNLLAMREWGERLGDDRNALAEATGEWRRMTGRAVPAMPAEGGGRVIAT